MNYVYPKLSWFIKLQLYKTRNDCMCNPDSILLVSNYINTAFKNYLYIYSKFTCYTVKHMDYIFYGDYVKLLGSIYMCCYSIQCTVSIN